MRSFLLLCVVTAPAWANYIHCSFSAYEKIGVELPVDHDKKWLPEGGYRAEKASWSENINGIELPDFGEKVTYDNYVTSRAADKNHHTTSVELKAAKSDKLRYSIHAVRPEAVRGKAEVPMLYLELTDVKNGFSATGSGPVDEKQAFAQRHVRTTLIRKEGNLLNVPNLVQVEVSCWPSAFRTPRE